MRKKKIRGACLALVFLLCGCSGSNQLKLSEMEADTLYVANDGILELANVENFKEEYYSKSELKDFIKESIKEYEGKEKNGTVKMEDFSVKDGIAKVLLTFDSADTYEEFQGEELQFITSDQSFDNLVLPDQFVKASDGSKVDKEQVLKEKDLKYVIVNSALDLRFGSDIIYYADAVLTGDNTAQSSGEKPAVIIFK